MNHRTRLDWLFYFSVLYRSQALSKIKIILKDDLKKIPGPSKNTFSYAKSYSYFINYSFFTLKLDWAMQTALFIFIRRKWEADQIIMKRFLNYYKEIQKNVMVKNLILKKSWYFCNDLIIYFKRFSRF